MRIPDFFIVGAPKCGTSAMFAYLRKHPEIFMAQGKELHFFGSDIHYSGRPTREQYLAHFSDAREEIRVGESSTSYLFSKRAAEEIREFNPSARIIIMLRNPMDMMYSLHSEMLYWLDEDIEDFEAALAAEEKRKQGLCWPRRPRIIEYLFYREVAKFTEQVQRYLQVFGVENVRIIIHDDFKSDRTGVYRETLRFLGVDPDFQPDFEIVNANKRLLSKRLQNFLLNPPRLARLVSNALMPRPLLQRLYANVRRLNTRREPRPPMDPELRKRLQAEFLPEVERLSELLGRDLTHWSKGLKEIDMARK